MKILDDLIASLNGDAPTRHVQVGLFWTAVWSRGCGLASTTGPEEGRYGTRFVEDAGSLTTKSALELASLAYSESNLETGIGVAAINSLIEIDESHCVELNAGDLLIERGRDKNVALIGRFPFVPALREAAAHLSVLELRPQPDELRAEEARKIVPQADVVAITASTLVNHTLEGLLELCDDDSFVVVLGPTTPLSPVLFDHGVDALSGTRVVEPELALRYLGEGAIFKQAEGVRLLTMER